MKGGVRTTRKRSADLRVGGLQEHKKKKKNRKGASENDHERFADLRVDHKRINSEHAGGGGGCIFKRAWICIKAKESEDQQRACEGAGLCVSKRAWIVLP